MKRMRESSQAAKVLMALSVALLCVPDNVAQAQETKERIAADCSVWSLKGIQLGMTLHDARLVVQALDKRLRHGRNLLRSDNRGKDWYRWSERASRGKHNYILPDHDSTTAPIISIVMPLGDPELSISELLDQLTARWGEPELRSMPAGAEVGVIPMTVASLRIDWTVTVWTDPVCDVRATLLAKTPKSTSPSAAHLKGFIVSLDSFKRVVKEKAVQPKNREVFLRY